MGRDCDPLDEPTPEGFSPISLIFLMTVPPDAIRLDRHLSEAAAGSFMSLRFQAAAAASKRAAHFLLDALYGGSADANLPGNFQNALAGP